jgi:hypothetical protein
LNKILTNMVLVQAAQLELDGAFKSLEAATLRGDKEGANAARGRAHDLLDSILDLKAAAMVEALKAGGR